MRSLTLSQESIFQNIWYSVCSILPYWLIGWHIRDTGKHTKPLRYALYPHTCTHTHSLLTPVNGCVKRRRYSAGWQASSVGVWVCLFCASAGGDCIRESHTQLHSPGDFCQPVILPSTPPSFLPTSAAHCWNRSTRYNGGAMRSKYAPPPSCPSALSHPLPPPSGNRKQATAPPWTRRGWLRRHGHSQPQHPDLPATTAIYTATLERSGLQHLAWNVHTYKTNSHHRLKMLISANLNEKGEIGKI